MNDREPLHSFDPGDPIDRTLSNAFGSRHVPPTSAPSLIDVRHRARRRQQRRTAGMVAAIVLVGAGGVGTYAMRHDSGRAALSPGDYEGGAPATTIACFTISTTVPPLPTVSTVSGLGVYEVQKGDTPALVAQKFDVTVDDLNAANAGLVGFDAFYVGLAITIPAVSPAPTGTLPPLSGGCGPDTQWTWHCTGDLGLDEFGRQVFQSCEQVEPGITTIPGELVPTTYPGQPIGTTTTMVYYDCPPTASCVPPDFTVVNGIDLVTTTTNAVYQSTTTSQG
jgi:LysM repeat protein